MLQKLVRQEWWTDTEVTTDENGRADVEAFKGEYSISCDGLSADASLTSDDGQTIVLK